MISDFDYNNDHQKLGSQSWTRETDNPTSALLLLTSFFRMDCSLDGYSFFFSRVSTRNDGRGRGDLPKKEKVSHDLLNSSQKPTNREKEKNGIPSSILG
jgi:hypothetical protein